jgi:small ligand-binding sensory domain FIST
MRWASTASAESVLDAAVVETSARIRSQLGSGVEPTLVVTFVSEHHSARYERVSELLGREFPSALLVGCSAGGVIGGGREIEQRPGFSLTAAALPGVELRPFHVDAGALPDRAAERSAWENLVGIAAQREPHFLLLADPFSFDAEAFLRGLDQAYPGSQKIGGLASGGRQPGVNSLFLGRDVYRSGLVGVALAGDIQVETIVAQGCRPIGQPMFVTKCQGNVLWQLDGEPAVKVLQELYERLDPDDQQLARHSLFLGIVMKEDREEYRQGDFLIRNLMGIDSARGALAVGAALREGSVVQFHLRDARTSAEDIEQLLTRYQRERGQAHPRGALLFSCLGRGAHLYGEPDHDTGALRRHLGDIPLGGFFCNGEIGPVHGTTFLHGYTSAFGLFSARSS